MCVCVVDKVNATWEVEQGTEAAERQGDNSNYVQGEVTTVERGWNKKGR